MPKLDADLVIAASVASPRASPLHRPTMPRWLLARPVAQATAVSGAREDGQRGLMRGFTPLNQQCLEKLVALTQAASVGTTFASFDFDYTLAAFDIGRLSMFHVLKHGAPHLSASQVFNALPYLERTINGVSLPCCRLDVLDAWKRARNPADAADKQTAIADFRAKAALYYELFDGAKQKGYPMHAGPFWLRWFAGCTQQQMRAMFRAALTEAYEAMNAQGRAPTTHWESATAGLCGSVRFTFTQPAVLRCHLVELMLALRQAGADTWIVSASPQVLVQDALAFFGAPIDLDHVWGAMPAISDGVLTGWFAYDHAHPVMHGDGKTQVISALRARNGQSRTFIFAAGDSKGDLPHMSQAAVGLWIDVAARQTKPPVDPEVSFTSHTCLPQAVDRDGQLVAAPWSVKTSLPNNDAQLTNDAPLVGMLRTRLVEAATLHGRQMVIATGWDCDDQLLMTWLLCAARRVYTETHAYPIKTVIVGGDDSRVNSALVKWYLDAARQLGWVPQGVPIEVVLGANPGYPKNRTVRGAAEMSWNLGGFEPTQRDALSAEALVQTRAVSGAAQRALIHVAYQSHRNCTLLAPKPMPELLMGIRDDALGAITMVTGGHADAMHPSAGSSSRAGSIPATPTLHLIVAEHGLLEAGAASIGPQETPGVLAALSRPNLPEPLRVLRHRMLGLDSRGRDEQLARRGSLLPLFLTGNPIVLEALRPVHDTPQSSLFTVRVEDKHTAGAAIVAQLDRLYAAALTELCGDHED